MAQGLKTGRRFPPAKQRVCLPVVPTALEVRLAAEVTRLQNNTVSGEIVFFLTGLLIGMAVMFVASIMK
jgi:hypothetical protein